MLVVCGPNVNRGHGLEAVLARRKRGTSRPEEDEILFLLVGHLLDYRPEPTLKERDVFGAIACE